MKHLAAALAMSTMVAVSAASLPEATFSVTTDKAQSVNVGNKEIAFNGAIRQIDGRSLMVFGEKGYKIPAKGLIGERGTMVLTFALAPDMRKSASPIRSLAILRFYGREEIGFYTFFNNRVLQYRFANQRRNFYGASEKMIPGKLYHAAFSWDGTRLRCYLNGKLIREETQPFTVDEKRITSLFIGPFRDDWHSTEPWHDDTLLGELRLYDRALSGEEIAALFNAEK